MTTMTIREISETIAAHLLYSPVGAAKVTTSNDQLFTATGTLKNHHVDSTVSVGADPVNGTWFSVVTPAGLKTVNLPAALYPEQVARYAVDALKSI